MHCWICGLNEEWREIVQNRGRNGGKEDNGFTQKTMVIVGTTCINTDTKEEEEEEHLGPFSRWVLGQFLYFNCSE